MIAALRILPINAPSLVDPSTVKVDGVLASGYGPCSLPCLRRSTSTSPIENTGTLELQQYSAKLRSRLSRRALQNLQSRESSSIFGSRYLEGFKDDRNSDCRSRRRHKIRCDDNCRDHHHHHSPGEGEGCCEPSEEECSFKQNKPSKECSKPLKEASETCDADQECLPDHPGDYIIKVSREMMGVFRYVEKVKRARIKDLAETLRKVAGACFLFSCVRGVISPLVEVYKTSPPDWKNLLLMLGSFDSFAITYLALKASEPMFQLSVLATESDCDMMGSIKKEEEHLLALAVELVKLFRSLRNVTLFTAVAQFVQVMHACIQLQNPAFTCNMSRIFGSWFECPWGS